MPFFQNRKHENRKFCFTCLTEFKEDFLSLCPKMQHILERKYPEITFIEMHQSELRYLFWNLILRIDFYPGNIFMLII